MRQTQVQREAWPHVKPKTLQQIVCWTFPPAMDESVEDRMWGVLGEHNVLFCLFLVIEMNIEIIVIVTNVTSMFLKFMSIGTGSKYIETDVSRILYLQPW